MSKWSSNDIKFITDNISSKSYVEMSIALDKTVKSVRVKAQRLKLKRPPRKHKCLFCGTEINLSRKFCSHSCSASYNNKLKPKKYLICVECGCEFRNKNPKTKFCSTSCMGQNAGIKNYERYLNNQLSYCNEKINMSSFKKFILIEQDGKCNVCGMGDEWNGKRLIFVLDHIDGNAYNNMRCNLRLVCPNCDSQLDTFKSKNKGNGRLYRKIRSIEEKAIIKLAEKQAIENVYV